mgnify:FL=1
MIVCTNEDGKEILVQNSNIDTVEQFADENIKGCWINFQSGRQTMVRESVTEIAEKEKVFPVVAAESLREYVKPIALRDKKGNWFTKLFFE